MPATTSAENKAFIPANKMAFIYRLQFSPFVMKLTGKYGFPLLTRLLGADEVLFLNWAYEEDPPMALPLAASDEPNRFPIQLYHRTATQADLSGKQVLEISCGHGGGASYLVRTLRPVSYTGLDLNAAGIDLCRKRYNLPGLDFVHGDAEDLPFADQSFDVVINVEAAHLYPRFPRFLAEVARVLRPGGYFLYADLRPRHQIAKWEAALADTPMRMVSHEVINAQVLRGNEKNPQPVQDLVAAALARWISRRAPAFLHGVAREATGVEGSGLYHAMQSGEISYRMYSFAKD
jgi:ubiquinone/menaquinone biosynthesis C-methylase UbiE